MCLYVLSIVSVCRSACWVSVSGDRPVCFSFSQSRIDALTARNEELDEADDIGDRQIVLATTYREQSLEALPQEHRDAG